MAKPSEEAVIEAMETVDGGKVLKTTVTGTVRMTEDKDVFMIPNPTADPRGM